MKSGGAIISNEASSCVLSEKLIETPKFFIELFFTRKVSTVIDIEGGWALSQLQNAKTSNIW